MKQIGATEALAAEFGVEVEAARGKAAVANDLVHGQGQLVHRVGELIGVPGVLVVAAIGVDAAENAVGYGIGHFVMEAVASERGVVRLDIHSIFRVQIVASQKAVDRGAVVIVLVLGGLL